MGLKLDSRGGANFTRIAHRTCNQTSDSQIWKIESFNGGWQIKAKWDDAGVAYSDCIGVGPADVIEVNWPNQHQRIYGCMGSNHTHRIQQTVQIEQRSYDSKWVIWTHSNPDRGMLDQGLDQFTALTGTAPMALEINPVSTLPAPAPISATSRTVTENGSSVTYTSLASDSSLIDVDVQLRMAGVDNPCLGTRTNSSTVRRMACSTTNDNVIFRIERLGDQWRIRAKATATGVAAYGRCIDMDNALDPDAILELEGILLRTCLPDWRDRIVDQTFDIEQRSTDNKWVLWGYPGVGIKDWGDDEPVGPSRTSYKAFDIVTISSILSATATPTPTATATPTPTATATPTATPAAVTYTDLSSSSALVGIDVQIKQHIAAPIPGVGDACLDVYDAISPFNRTGLIIWPCETKDQQIWKIVSYDGGFQLQNKAGSGGTQYNRCLDTKARYWTDSDPQHYPFTYSAPCVNSTHADHEHQKIAIKQRSSDNKWVLFPEDGTSFAEGSSIWPTTDESKWMAFDIIDTADVASIPTPTPTATPTATPIPVELPHNLMNVQVRIKIAGTDNCMAIKDDSLVDGQEVVRAACDADADGQKWIIKTLAVPNKPGNDRLQIRSATTENSTTPLCLEGRFSEDTSNPRIPFLVMEDTDVKECVGNAHQRILIFQATGGDWWIFSDYGIGLKDQGDGQPFISDLTTWTEFEISALSNASATPTPTPTPTPTATPTPTPTATPTPTPTATPTPTPTTSTQTPISSDLLNVNVQIKVDGVNGCFDVKYGNPYNGQNVWRYGCNGTDAQTWQITPFNGGYQIKVKAAPNNGNEYTVCLDSRGDHDDPNLTGSRVDVWSCVKPDSGAKENQTFWIYEAPDGDGTYHIFSHEDVAIHDQGDTQNFTHHNSTYTQFQITAVTGGL